MVDFPSRELVAASETNAEAENVGMLALGLKDTDAVEEPEEDMQEDLDERRELEEVRMEEKAAEEVCNDVPVAVMVLPVEKTKFL